MFSKFKDLGIVNQKQSFGKYALTYYKDLWMEVPTFPATNLPSHMSFRVAELT